MQIDFIPIDYDYFDWQGRNYMTIIGRDDKGKRVCILDSFEPYFWAVLKQGVPEKNAKELQRKIEKIKIESPGRTTKVEKTELCKKKFLGKAVQAIKVFITNYKDAHAVADKMGFPEIEARREYDISLITRYIIEKKLIPLSWYRISGEISDDFGISNLDADLCIRAEKIEKIEDKQFSPKIMAYDIEADAVGIGMGEILMISLFSEKFKRVLTWKKSPAKLDYVEYCKDEADMLEKFA